MAYRFFADSTVEANVHRILGEQLEGAIDQLSNQLQSTPDRAIHDARKHLKKGRSLLRLVRKSMARETYRLEENRLRDQGRLLAPCRDSEVYQHTLDDLLDTYGLTLDTHGFTDLRASLAKRHQVQLAALTDRDIPMAAIIGELRGSKARLNQLALDKSGWEALAKNLKRIYRQGQARYQSACDSDSPEAFHQWRKRVKDLWHDTCLLRQLWPPIMTAFSKETHRLTKILGDEHDITALRRFLLKHSEEVAIEEVQLQVLLPLMEHRQHRLRRQARELGQKLYCETAAAFTHRIAAYW
ncbi:CHAD domain-containing protein [Nodosilinea nodulosa]|uniref:CHAD domain-containing protein n=1 Tax=Nodosilinea nodulosa TaxID=416001 RepID=UPI0002FFD325|nr:CHAD domain-containing protein [Nodosilinea nodulosa]